MSADIRIIRLIRKNIHFQNNKEELPQETNVSFFATDYFDVMEVEKAEVSAPLMTIMGVWPNEKLAPGDILAQSFSLYCNERMLKQETGIDGYGDPFIEENQDNSFPFLSIIQVHIMPDAMRYIAEKNQSMADSFYVDLYEAVRSFISANTGMELIVRIYKMLSTGDFAIAVRSNKAEVSFLLASWIRQRSTQEASDKNLQLVLYKTYTLLTFNSGIIQHEDMEAENTEDRFVLRGCYSNRYWGKKTEIRKELAEKISWENRQLYGINGRYDFSVRVTEKEFLELYPIIQAYKKGAKIECSGDIAEKEKLNLVEYMTCLMCNGYLSYVNERYLIAQETWEKQLHTESYTNLRFLPVHSNDAFLEHKIKEKYRYIKKKYVAAKEELDTIAAYRKNMLHYMELLEKLIMLCLCINESSDTRIYAITLLEQLDVIIDSVRVYVDMYLNTEKSDKILDLLEDYIRESAWVLDGYAQYIRNNNLQSIQTPNYNLETNMSMEKLLIGYGEILEVFIKFYQKYQDQKMNTERALPESKPKRILPVVVPALHKRDLSVEVLFMEGVSNNWKEEKSGWDKIEEEGIRHCMVVSIPVLKELMDIRVMVVSLFHEVAHQFRYESREIRNDAVLEYIIHTLMQQIAQNISQRLQQKLDVYDREEEFSQFLGEALKDAYLNHYYKKDTDDIRKYNFRSAPFNSFEEELIRDLETNLEEKIKEESIKDALKEFLGGLLSYQEQLDAECSEAITLLDELLMITQEGHTGSKKGTKDQIKKCAYALAVKCAYQNITPPSNIEKPSWNGSKLRRWVNKMEEFDFIKDWEEYFAIYKTEEPNVQIWHFFDKFATWIDDNYETGNIGDGKEEVKIFLQDAYEQICNSWKTRKERVSKDTAARKQAAMARMLGIDFNCKDNYNIFAEEVSDVIRKDCSNIIDLVDWRIKKYREETADMLMCSVLKLSPIGYINLLAVNWPIGKEFSIEFIARCVNVFLFQWCLEKVKDKDDEYEISEERFIKQCGEVVETLEKTVKAIKEKCGIFKEEKQNTKCKGRKVLEELADRLWEIEEECSSSRADLLKTEYGKQYSEALKVYGNMAKLMSLPVYHGIQFIMYLDDFTELREDYLRGYKNMKLLNDEMLQSNDLAVRHLGEFCKTVGEWQNDPNAALADKVKTEEMNKTGLEFLLEMYYANKQRIAQEVGK